MADFFQPGPSKTAQTTSTTLSPSQQALQEFKIQLLGQILNSMGGNKPSFKSFVAGGPSTNPVPQGLGSGSANVLSAMMQPGAFTSTTTGSGTQTGATPSVMSDLSQLALLGLLASKSGALEGLGGILAHPLDSLGGWLHIGAQPGPLGTSEVPSASALDASTQNQGQFLGGLFSQADPSYSPMMDTGQGQDILSALLNGLY